MQDNSDKDKVKSNRYESERDTEKGFGNTGNGDIIADNHPDGDNSDNGGNG